MTEPHTNQDTASAKQQVTVTDLCAEITRLAERLEGIPDMTTSYFTAMCIRQVADQLRALVILSQPISADHD